MQLINVAYGGTLGAGPGLEAPAPRTTSSSTDRAQPLHPVEVRDGSVLADWPGGRGS
jgi:putative glutamine amidotransferase